MSSKELDEYEYLAGEEFGYKAGAVEQAKYEYAPLDKAFNRELEESDHKTTFQKIKKCWR